MSAFFFGDITVSRNDFFASNQTISNMKEESGNAHAASPKTLNMLFENSSTNFYQVAAAIPKIESPTCSKNQQACPSEMIDESDFISFDFCLNAPLIKKSSSILNSKEIDVSEFSIREEGNSYELNLNANNNIQYTANFSQSSIDISDFSL
ncbi:hypothetical protein ABPG72_004070 [Tetrahymena utriculariae]